MPVNIPVFHQLIIYWFRSRAFMHISGQMEHMVAARIDKTVESLIDVIPAAWRTSWPTAATLHDASRQTSTAGAFLNTVLLGRWTGITALHCFEQKWQDVLKKQCKRRVTLMDDLTRRVVSSRGSRRAFQRGTTMRFTVQLAVVTCRMMEESSPRRSSASFSPQPNSVSGLKEMRSCLSACFC